MPDPDKALVSALREAFRGAVESFIEKVQAKSKLGGYVSHHWRWCDVSRSPNGMANISSSSFSGPVDLTTALDPPLSLTIPAPTDKPKSVSEQVPELVELIRLVLSHSMFLRRFSLGGPDPEPGEDWTSLDTAASLIAIGVERDMKSIASRMLFRASQGVVVDLFEEAYLPFERAYFQDSLPLNILYPLICLGVDCGDIQVDDNLWIVRVSEDVIQSRAIGLGSSSSVYHAYSHALKVEGFELSTSERGGRVSTMLGDASVYFNATEIAELFMAALRAVVEVKTGYSQVIAVPIGWATHYQEGLPDTMGARIRLYPPEFDEQWLGQLEVSRVSAADLVQAGQLYRNLRTCDEKRMRIAAQRLNTCSLRVSEEDSLLDAVMALEALVLAGEKGGQTFKLALRVAALVAMDSSVGETAHDVFRAVKKIYDARSKLVHEIAVPDENRQIEIGSHGVVPVNELAVRYLRSVIRILGSRPELRDRDVIDRHLLKLIEQGREAQSQRSEEVEKR